MKRQRAVVEIKVSPLEVRHESIQRQFDGGVDARADDGYETIFGRSQLRSVVQGAAHGHRIIGIALPIGLLIGKPLVDGGGMLGSISAYYYSGMRNYFVGIMCALAVFFFSYKYAQRDNFLSTLTSIFAVGVAFSPTKPSGGDTTWTTWLHFICAFLFFLTLAYFAYFIFTLPPLPKEQREPRKRLRNKIYRICGVTIVVCLVLVRYSIVF